MSLSTLTASNRRKYKRNKVAAVAVATQPDGSPGVFLVRDLSAGGASMLGDAVLLSGQKIPLTLYLAGRAPMALTAKVLRRQVTGRRGRCAVSFKSLSAEHSAVIADAVEVGRDPGSALLAPDVFIVADPSSSVGTLTRQLFTLGHTPRHVVSPFEAAAWLHPGAVAMLVDQQLMEVGGWNFIQFVRDSWPHVRRIVIGKEIHSFRLNLALRCGLVEAALESPFRAAVLAEKLGVSRDEGMRRRAL